MNPAKMGPGNGLRSAPSAIGASSQRRPDAGRSFARGYAAAKAPLSRCRPLCLVTQWAVPCRSAGGAACGRRATSVAGTCRGADAARDDGAVREIRSAMAQRAPGRWQPARPCSSRAACMAPDVGAILHDPEAPERRDAAFGSSPPVHGSSLCRRWRGRDSPRRADRLPGGGDADRRGDPLGPRLRQRDHLRHHRLRACCCCCT